MYNYGGGSCGCSNWGSAPYYQQPYMCCGQNNSNYAIVLVLFILLVIVIGARWSHQ